MLILLASAALACPVQDELQRIDAAGLQEIVQFLASDELRGRATGTPENEVAAEYLAAALKERGLLPGAGESFLQAVALQRIGSLEAPELVTSVGDQESISWPAGEAFDAIHPAASTGALRVLTIEKLSDLPEEADEGVALFLSSSSRSGRKWLKERGAERGAGWGAVLSRGSKRPGRPWRQRSARLARINPLDETPAPTPWVRVNGDLRTALEEGRVEELRLSIHALEGEVAAHNVVGVIRGVGTKERPELADEVVVLSAHFDHIGVSSRPGPAGEDATEEDADRVFNGADDDASGVACVVELAEAFAKGPAPARTLLFLLVTGEEIGLLGTKHYLDAPLFPLELTCCNLNYEMIGRADELVGGAGRLWLTGHNRSNLMAAIEEQGISISADLRPEENFFERSDNYAFAVRGIVAQTFSTYNMHSDYHKVGDEWQTLDYEHMETATREAYRIARLVADGAIDPAWLPGGKPRGR